MEDNMTAVDWLFEKLWNQPKDKLIWRSIFSNAKTLEMEQIIDAYDNGFANGFDDGKYDDEPKYQDAEQYYKETYGQ